MPALARMFHELMWRDRADGCATGQPQGVGSEAYLNGTSQGPTPEDARKDGQIRGRSKRLMKYPGWGRGGLFRAEESLQNPGEPGRGLALLTLRFGLGNGHFVQGAWQWMSV
jgi:hypothetical protein